MLFQSGACVIDRYGLVAIAASPPKNVEPDDTARRANSGAEAVRADAGNVASSGRLGGRDAATAAHQRAEHAGDGAKARQSGAKAAVTAPAAHLRR